MKTRENELHEPLIEVFTGKDWWGKYKGIAVQISCKVCERVLYSTDWWKHVTEEQLTERAKEATPNYCPNCGARLKEVDE